MVTIVIDYDKCKGPDCYECVDICPMEILVIGDDKVDIVNTDECNFCEVCMDVCNEECIEIKDD